MITTATTSVTPITPFSIFTIRPHFPLSDKKKKKSGYNDFWGKVTAQYVDGNELHFLLLV